ncbi:MAG: VPLPA-CTERM sorting domain-containing protein, partial [Boseongicola sp.]|nr:VPLPA-CTERM sorting domain-containing protein [Boseongicola sp.]
GDSGSLTASFTGKYVVNPDYGTDGTLSGVVENAHSVQRHNNGLGVCNVGSCETGEDPYHTVDGASAPDGRQITDFVEIAFFTGIDDPVDVTLTSLTFGWVGDIYDVYSGTNGMYEILVSELSDALIGAGASLVFEGTATATPNIIGGLDVEVLPDLAAFTDNLFGIKAGIGGSWKLKSATVEYSVPEIPLPAAGWLMIAGIGSIAALRRKKT